MARTSAAKLLWDRLAVPPSTVVPLAAGVVLQRLRPWPRPDPLGGRTRDGALLVLAGVVLNGWSSASRPGPIDRPGRLVTAGPYAVSRHPMYLGWHLVHLGVVLAGRSTWSVIGLAAAALLGHRTVLAEERMLGARFGGEYAAYRSRVRRYV